MLALPGLVAHMDGGEDGGADGDMDRGVDRGVDLDVPMADNRLIQLNAEVSISNPTSFHFITFVPSSATSSIRCWMNTTHPEAPW